MSGIWLVYYTFVETRKPLAWSMTDQMNAPTNDSLCMGKKTCCSICHKSPEETCKRESTCRVLMVVGKSGNVRILCDGKGCREKRGGGYPHSDRFWGEVHGACLRSACHVGDKRLSSLPIPPCIPDMWMLVFDEEQEARPVFPWGGRLTCGEMEELKTKRCVWCDRNIEEASSNGHRQTFVVRDMDGELHGGCENPHCQNAREYMIPATGLLGACQLYAMAMGLNVCKGGCCTTIVPHAEGHRHKHCNYCKSCMR